MKKIILNLGLLFSVITNNAQVSQEQLIPASDTSGYLDVNNISTVVTNGAYLWEDMNTELAAHIVKDSNKVLGYAASIWMGGKTDSDDLKFAGELYSRDYDFYVGPYSTNGNSEDFEKYNRVWKINRWEVEHFRLNRNRPNYIIPEVILSWPAHGDESLGQAKNLAPFHDENNDGIYNPYDGDYPEFDLDNELSCDANKLLGDQVIYTIFHDAGEHTESKGQQIGVEVHLQAYAYVSADELNNTVFYKYDLYNRSITDLKEFYFGFHHDTDIGCSGDDFFGSCENRGMTYIYNGTLVDGEECFGVIPWKGAKPIVGVDFVRSSLGAATGAAYFVRSGTGPVYASDPAVSIEYYNYLNSVWLDGSHFVLGSTGHYSDPNSDPNVEVDFLLNDNIGWSETSSSNTPGDRKGLLRVGPTTFNNGENISATVAVIYDKVDVDADYSNYDEIDKLKQTDDVIQDYADNCFEGQPCLPPQAVMEVVNEDQFFQFSYPFTANKVTWDFGDGIVVEGNHQIHKFLQSGDFTVCVTVETDCGEDTYCEQISVTSLDVGDEVITKIDAQVIPNPTNGEGEILLGNHAGNLAVSFYDVTGRLIKTISNITTDKVKFTLPQTTALYHYKIANSQGTVLSTGKIIVE